MNARVDFPLVVLDCDGTIVDSQSAICAIMQECFVTHGLTPPEASAVRRIVGLSLDEAIARLLSLPTAGDPALMADTYRSVSSRIRAEGAFEEPMFPGARNAIEGLSDAGCVLGIATGKSSGGLRNTLAAHGIAGYFTTLQTSDVAVGKPNPDMLLRAMRETGVSAHATVMVGDTTYDMEMARAAGTYAIGVSWGYHETEALRVAGAHCILDSYADLMPAIRDVLTLDHARGRMP